MKKVMVEKYVYEIGDVLDISNLSSGIHHDWPNATKANHYKESNKIAMVVGITRKAMKDDSYTMLLNTGKTIMFHGADLNEAKLIGAVDLHMLFGNEKEVQ